MKQRHTLMNTAQLVVGNLPTQLVLKLVALGTPQLVALGTPQVAIGTIPKQLITLSTPQQEDMCR